MVSKSKTSIQTGYIRSESREETLYVRIREESLLDIDMKKLVRQPQMMYRPVDANDSHIVLHNTVHPSTSLWLLY